jgi:hypothetical protein
MKVSQAKRLKELERENSRLKGAVAELTLDKVILKEAQVIIERWRQEYNTIRPHSSLNYRPPAPETVWPKDDVPIFPMLDSQRLEEENCQTLT